LHDLPEDYADGEARSASAARRGRAELTDREAWLCVRSRLMAPPPRGAWLVWVSGPLAVGLAALLAILWLRGASVVPRALESTPPPATVEATANASAATGPAVSSPSELTSGESPVQLALSEGSFALVEPHGSLALLDLRAEHVALRLDSGAVYVHAAPQRVGELRVYAGEHVVVVHGTGFRVERSSDHLRVQLRHGSVEVRSLSPGDGEGRFLAPGEEISVDEHQPLRLARLGRLSRGELDLLAAEEGDTLAPQSTESGWQARAHHAVASAMPAPRVTKEPAVLNPPLPQDVVPGEPGPPRVPSLQADIARCRALHGVPERLEGEPETVLRLDLTVSETGQVIAAAAEHGGADPRLSGCLAEAALDWHLDAPPESLRGMQFVFPIKL
jgi:hypothetical protein